MTQPTEQAPRIRDGHTLNLRLNDAEIWLDVNCPHDHIDWAGVPLMDRPRCHRVADPHDGTPDSNYDKTCIIAEWSEASVGAADLLHLGDRTFTVTALPIEVEYWWEGGFDGQLYLAPIEKPPGETEYKAMVEAYRSSGRVAGGAGC